MHKVLSTLVCLLLLAGAYGCAHTHQPSPARPRSLDPPKHLDPLLNPRDFLYDYSYPDRQVKQSFSWTANRYEWRIRWPAQIYAYAGYKFRNAFDFSKHRTTTSLEFKLQPATAANSLMVGLVDGDFVQARILVDVPLASTLNSRGFQNFSIPLSLFPDQGNIMEGSAEELQQPFDWSDVREICFITPTGLPRPQEVVVKDLLFHRRTPLFQ